MRRPRRCLYKPIQDPQETTPPALQPRLLSEHRIPATTMKLSIATVAVVALLLLVSASQTDATKEHIFLPFHWAGNIVKDAAQYMIAFKLSIATKLLAMITGNRSFRASIQYDSRLEKYQEASAASGLLYQPAPTVAPRPDPLQVEKDFKVDWFPNFKFGNMHLPKFSLPHPHLPSLPKFRMPHLSLPHLSLPHFPHFSKFHDRSQQPSAPAVFSIPKFASGYFNGGFKIGHGVPANGAVGGQSLQATGPAGLQSLQTTGPAGLQSFQATGPAGLQSWQRNPMPSTLRQEGGAVLRRCQAFQGVSWPMPTRRPLAPATAD
ncbi:secreted protein, putative [Ixodes scapularis]|uniref:Secreted protein, putative n=1 Tax=Ixodes scapularis TaxID=6945 RepID=B7PDP8_IXOSC|nr:secreted protein, putative [Ixodes scapularis]|eukprot:XP_002410992.1 secreted protein, putative [Ixodes scapularis]